MEASNQIQKLGQQEYRRKNYHAALNFFDSVISTEKQLDVSVLDCRAATYEKLGDLHAALKDGRRMISDYKTDCAGYLRTGKILQLLDKDSVALGIYKYGLRKLLRDIHDSLNQKCGPSKAKDPLTVLPLEIAQMIMGFLDFRHIVSLTRVSTTWRDYLKSTPRLWANLDFSKAKANISRAAVQKYILFSGRTVARLTTQQSINLQHVVTQCKTLEHLQIGGGYSNASLIKDPLMLKIPEIRELRLAGWKSRATIPPASGLAMTRLVKLQLSDYKGHVSPLALPSLQTLHLDTCMNIMHEFSNHANQSGFRTDGIAELSLSCASALDLHCLVWLVGPNFGGLKTLHLPQCMEITDTCLRTIISMGIIDHVVDLDLSGPRLTDHLVQLLAFRAFRLERIKIASTPITGVGVKALVTKPGSKLQYLDITDCSHVSSDAIAFARHLKGLTLKCGEEKLYGKKKKVRYE
ncbi:MAG: hypothetical protein LQ337_000268 [Flavoplaca oasis]|nr:MAG: hypothetical protein LQ337_000268 [Flavoplaca oasis]